MELMQEVKGYSDSREEEEEEETAEEIITREESSGSKHNYPFSSPSFSSSPSLTNYTLHPHHHHHPEEGITAIESHNSSSGLGLLHQHQDVAASSNFTNSHTKQLDFMELSLGNNNNKDVSDEANFQGSGGVVPPPNPAGYGHASAGSSSSSNNNNHPTEKEHMFDKVVTPSDVGKLNRLVIPKQHAEKYFPLDSSTNEKGLLLNFEDRNGKLWRFRYSYWNSSQSYVMTKGWSRFVKEKKLDAGDVVSFQRGVGELYRHRLFIDWRRRPDHGPDPSTTLFTPFFLPNQPHLSQYSIRWGGTGRLYSLPSPQAPRNHNHLQQQLNYNNNMYPFQHQQQHHHGGGTPHYNNYNELSSGSGSVYYLRSTPSMPRGDQSLTRQRQQEGGNISPMIIDSVPVAHHHQQHHHHHHHGVKSGSSSSSSKRLRLFGVNMECASSSSSSSPSEDPKCCSLLSSTSVAHVTMANSLPSSSLPPLQLLRVPHEDTLLSPSTRFGDQRGEASMLFDLDPSLQYRQ